MIHVSKFFTRFTGIAGFVFYEIRERYMAER